VGGAATVMTPLLLINTVALPVRHVPLVPRLQALAQSGWQRPLVEVLPAVTCTAQASMLTGTTASEHGIVGNGWLFRDTNEVRFWQQSNRLIQTEPLYVTLRRRAAAAGRPFRCAKVFWWFNQGAAVDISVTPKPYYGADGNKAFGVSTTPADLAEQLNKKLGPFPFHTFWGPAAGLPSTQWIARAAAEILRSTGGPPDLTLVYLPHLDYETQRLGPDRCDWRKLGAELDSACAPLLDAAQTAGVRTWIVNEYTHMPVNRPVYVNRVLRQKGLLRVRPGPFGETLETFESLAFAVCDHQVAHIYLKDAADGPRVRDALAGVPGLASIVDGVERASLGLNHSRAGDLIALSERDSWFAYPFWIDDRQAPDFARTVDIHRKPGYDPCELLLDPRLLWPKGRVLRRLLQKKLGFRTLFDVIPLDASLVKGSHGLQMEESLDKPALIGEGSPPRAPEIAQTAIRDLLLGHG